MFYFPEKSQTLTCAIDAGWPDPGVVHILAHDRVENLLLLSSRNWNNIRVWRNSFIFFPLKKLKILRMEISILFFSYFVSSLMKWFVWFLNYFILCLKNCLVLLLHPIKKIDNLWQSQYQMYYYIDLYRSTLSSFRKNSIGRFIGERQEGWSCPYHPKSKHSQFCSCLGLNRFSIIDKSCLIYL